MGWVCSGLHLWVPGTHLGWWALGTLGCWGYFRLEGGGEHPWVLGTHLGWWALGAFGCWGPFRLEEFGVHPWVPGTPWVGWELLFFGCQGSPQVAGHQGAPLGARDPLGVGWALGTFGCWGPYRLEGMGVHPWVLGTAWVGWALGFFGCRGSPKEAGHQGAPLGARDSLGVVGIGYLWVLGSL